MEIYLVGGAVRDQLLGLPVHERDWVVTGATPDQLLALHFTPVGKDFPVFLHPNTHEEYALARTERQSGKGYKGFVVNAAPEVTLEQDLQRRDLTINAMAQTSAGALIDPFLGKEDIVHKRLRHVSPAFVEDPVRVLRVARFMARLGPLGFSVMPETLSLMQCMSKQGELDHLVPERVWKEWCQALCEKAPHLFIQTLEESGALSVLFPEIQPLSETMDLLMMAAQHTEDPVIRFALMLSHLPLAAVMALCQRYKVPNRFSELAICLVNHAADYDKLNQASPAAVLVFFKQLDAFRKSQHFQAYLTACRILQVKHGKPLSGLQQHIDTLRKQCQSINAHIFLQQGLVGSVLGERIDAERLAIIQAFIAALDNRSDPRQD